MRARRWSDSRASLGRCLDLGCGTGVALKSLQRLGWSVVGTDVSDDLLQLPGGEACRRCASRRSCPSTMRASMQQFRSGRIPTSTTSGVAWWELARALRSGAPFVYIGAHPCFVGPHSRFFGATGVPELHGGYARAGRYDDGPSFAPEGFARGSARHLPLGLFVQAFLDAGFTVERFKSTVRTSTRSSSRCAVAGERRRAIGGASRRRGGRLHRLGAHPGSEDRAPPARPRRAGCRCARGPGHHEPLRIRQRRMAAASRGEHVAVTTGTA